MTALMILITLMNSAGGKASDLFGELTGIAVLLTMLPYFYSCVDLIRFEGVNIRNFVSLICSVLGSISVNLATTWRRTSRGSAKKGSPSSSCMVISSCAVGRFCQGSMERVPGIG